MSLSSVNYQKFLSCAWIVQTLLECHGTCYRFQRFLQNDDLVTWCGHHRIRHFLWIAPGKIYFIKYNQDLKRYEHEGGIMSTLQFSVCVLGGGGGAGYFFWGHPAPTMQPMFGAVVPSLQWPVGTQNVQ